jgi:predicted NAD-dependent protein-ADP-ribosyltransferase YbiA (DUF1768 family)
MEVLETMIGFLGVCNDKGENHLGKLLMEARKEISL